MPTPIERARRDLADLDAEIAADELGLIAKRARRTDIAGFIAMYDKYTATDAAKPAVTIHAGSLKPDPEHDPEPPMTASMKDRIGDETEAFIKNEGKPKSLGDVFDMLTLMGSVPGGKNPRQNLSGILHRDGRFLSTAYGWWLADRQLVVQAEGKA